MPLGFPIPSASDLAGSTGAAGADLPTSRPPWIRTSLPPDFRGSGPSYLLTSVDPDLPTSRPPWIPTSLPPDLSGPEPPYLLTSVDPDLPASRPPWIQDLLPPDTRASRISPPQGFRQAWRRLRVLGGQKPWGCWIHGGREVGRSGPTEVGR